MVVTIQNCSTLIYNWYGLLSIGRYQYWETRQQRFSRKRINYWCWPYCKIIDKQ
jgi:hypothetical protein